MLKNYQFKWYLIVTGILTLVTTTSLLLKFNSYKGIQWWEYPEYALQIFLIMLTCWLIHGFFLLRRNSGLKNYTRYLISNTIATCCTFALTFVLYVALPKSSLIDNGVGFDNFSNCVVHFIGSFLVSTISYVVFYSIHTNAALQASQLDNEVLEQVHLRAQLLSLQQQISPHFLFNSLSTLKTIATDQPTKNYIVQLATVYRYVLNFNDHYLTPLANEVNFIRSYLYILHERFEDALVVSIKIPEEHLRFEIPPLSLQLLVENAIKHNTLSSEQPLHLTILTDETPVLIVTNNLQIKKLPEEGNQMGLKNISERYKLLMQLPVQITNDGDYFSVKLPLRNP